MKILYNFIFKKYIIIFIKGLIRKATTETPLFRNFGSDSNEDNIYDFEVKQVFTLFTI